MKKLYALFTFILLILFACQSDKSTNKNSKITNLYSIGDGENNLARQEFEYMRLQNPTTGLIPDNIREKEYNFVMQMPHLKSNSNFTWQSKGPDNVGGRTRALTIDVANDNRILAGGVSGGLWISENAGVSFTKITPNTQLHSVTSIAQDTRSGFQNIWYYATGEQSGNSADLKGNGIYKSTDNGLTWNLLLSTSNDSAKQVSTLGDFSYVSDVKVNPLNGDIVAATFAGIFLSQDGGMQWQNVLTADNSPNGFGYVNFGNQTSVYIDDNGVYYASLSSDAQDKGIWRSVDGIAWTSITPSGFAAAYRRMECAANPFNQNEVLFIVDATTNPTTDNHQLWHYTYVSGNGSGAGGNWEDKTANLPNGTCTGFYDFDFGYYQSQNSYDMVITYHPTQEDVVFLGGTNLYRSTDAFSTTNNSVWIGGYQCDANAPSNYVWPNHHPDNHALVFSKTNANVMYSATDGGLSKTTDCLASNIIWTSINNGYSTSQFYAIAIENTLADDDCIIGGLQDNGTKNIAHANSSQNWLTTFYGDGGFCAIANNKEHYYISWQGGKTFKFDIDNNGDVQALTRIDPSNSTEDYLFINPFILDPNNTNTMYFVEGKYIWRNDSLDVIPLINDEYNGITQGWNRINESAVGGFLGYVYITALDMSKANSDILYYGTHNGGIYKLSGLLSGAPVQTSIKRSGMPAAYVSCIEANPNNENELIVTYSNYEVKSIFHTTDGGDTWTNVSGSLEENPDGSGAGPSVNWANIHQINGDSLYFVGTTSGLFSTKHLDGSNTIWQREAENEIGNVPVTMICSREVDNYVAVATHGAGVFTNKYVETSIEDIAKTNEMHIGFPYPNPSKEMLKIDIVISKKSNINYTLVDVLGNQIKRANLNDLAIGENVLSLFFPELNKGVYFLVFSNGNEKLSRKIVIE